MERERTLSGMSSRFLIQVKAEGQMYMGRCRQRGGNALNLLNLATRYVRPCPITYAVLAIDGTLTYNIYVQACTSLC